MATLSAAQRKRIPSREFGVPSKARTPEEKAESGNYPMPDKAHARDAKARASAAYRDGRISKAEYDRINRKADSILYAGGHGKHGHVYLVDHDGKRSPRGRVKPDNQPSYKMRAKVRREDGERKRSKSER